MNMFERIFKGLYEEGVKYLVVGGVAVNLHGYLRGTGDLDVSVLLEEENLAKMTEAMRKLGYVERLPIKIQELQNEAFAKKLMEERNLLAFSYMPDGDVPVIVDVVVDGSLRFKELFERSVVKKLDGLDVPVISIDDLIDFKKKAGRPKDLEDLRWLVNSKKLDE